MIKNDNSNQIRDFLVCIFAIILIKILADTDNETLLGTIIIPFILLSLTETEDLETALIYYAMMFFGCFGLHVMSETWEPLRGFRYIR